MSLNCKPGQLAWIDVPRTPQHEAVGLSQLQGRVVQTLRLTSPTEWEVEPALTIRIVGPVPAHWPVKPGDTMRCLRFPDSMLRPFKDFPPEELGDVSEGLRSALSCRE